jgi:hypothetical protein
MVYFNMSDSAVCYLVVAVVAIALLVYGFIQILGRQMASENDLQVIQRQIRGFAFVMLAPIVLGLGYTLCSGSLNLRNINRSLKLDAY